MDVYVALMLSGRPAKKREGPAEGPSHNSNYRSLNLVADQKIVHDESDPAECHHGDGEEDLVEGLKFVVLEDVEHAPHGGHDAQDVNDGSDHKI